MNSMQKEYVTASIHDQASQKTVEDCPQNLEARDEVIGAFRDLVKSSFDPRHVEKWVSASPVRQNLFDDMAVGQIKWPRSLGRPDAANLFDGFIFRTKFWVDIWHIGLDGSIVYDLRGWEPGVTPNLRDTVSDPDHYSVQYLFQTVSGHDVDKTTDNEIEIQFSDAAWYRPARYAQPQKLYLSSHGFQFHRDGTFIALPDIFVGDHPFVRT